MLELADGLRTDGLTKERKLKMIYLMSGDQRVPYENLAHAREKAQSNLLFWRDTFKKCTHDDNYWNEVLYELSESGGRDEAERLAGEFPKGTSRHWLLVALTLTSDNPWRDFQDALKENDEPLRSLIADANFLPWLERVRPERHALMKSVFGEGEEWKRHLYLVRTFLLSDKMDEIGEILKSPIRTAVEELFVTRYPLKNRERTRNLARRFVFTAKRAFEDPLVGCPALIEFLEEGHADFLPADGRAVEIAQLRELMRALADEREPGTEMTLSLPDGTDVVFCWCPATTSEAWKTISGGVDFFWMGSPRSEPGHQSDEIRHRVKLTEGFWMGKYPLTQKQWKGLMGDDAVTKFKGATRPVDKLSWDDCREFIDKWNDVMQVKISFPTEAQWEYACRAGTDTPFSFGLKLNGEEANCDGTSPYGTRRKGTSLGRTSCVGKYPPNAWGLCDMHGNVWEWCRDWYGRYGGAATDPTGPTSGTFRVLRGGGYLTEALGCRSAFRDNDDPLKYYIDVGFRLCCSAGLC